MDPFSQLKPAKTIEEAQQTAYAALLEHRNNNYGIMIIPVMKVVEVRINTNDPISIRQPSGWAFTYQRDRGANWELTESKEVQ